MLQAHYTCSVHTVLYVGIALQVYVVLLPILLFLGLNLGGGLGGGLGTGMGLAGGLGGGMGGGEWLCVHTYVRMYKY